MAKSGSSSLQNSDAHIFRSFSRSRIERGRPGLWENPSEHVYVGEQDAVTIKIKIARSRGLSPSIILRERGYLRDSRPKPERKESSHESGNFSSHSQNSPLSSLLRLEQIEDEKGAEHREILCSCLKQAFPSMFHAFAFFDVERRGFIGERELSLGVRKLASDPKTSSSLAFLDLKQLLEELGQKRGTGGFGLSMSAFARFFYFGDDLSDWKEKLSQARQNRPRRRSSAASLSALFDDSESRPDLKEIQTENQDAMQLKSVDMNSSTDMTAIVRGVLGESFGGAAQAVASIDSRQVGYVPTCHLAAVICQNLQGHEGAELRAQLQEWLSGLADGRGNVSATALIAALTPSGEAGDAAEALGLARIALAERVSAESHAQSGSVSNIEWQAARPLRAEVVAQLRGTFANVFDAYLCMAGDDDTLLTISQLKVGLGRLGLGHIEVGALLRESGLTSPMPARAAAVQEQDDNPALLAVQFCSHFTWHEIPDWGLGVALSPGGSSRWADGKLSGANQGKLLQAEVMEPLVLQQSDALLEASSPTGSLGGMIESITWQEQMLQRFASVAAVPLERLDAVGADRGNLILVVYPDIDARGPSSTVVARRIREALLAANGELCSWDPAIFKGCDVTLLPTGQTAWRVDTGWSLSLRSSSGLTPPSVARERRPAWPRSRPGFKTLGAQAHWKMLDCLTAPQSPSGGQEGRASRSGRGQRYPCTILRHTGGISVELLHHSFGGFVLRAGRGLPPMSYGWDGSLLERKPDSSDSCHYSHPSSGVCDAKSNASAASSPIPWRRASRKDSLPALVSPGSGGSDVGSIVSAEGNSQQSKRRSQALSAGEDLTAGKSTVGTTKAETPKWLTPEDFPDTKFSPMISRKAGRWSFFLSVPVVLVLNDCDPNIQLALTPTGLIFFGGGPAGRAVIVEKSSSPVHASLIEARMILRHIPTMPNDSTELDEICFSSFQNRRPEQIQQEFDLERIRQNSILKMLLSGVLPEHCLCTDKLLELTAVENGLSVHDKINRRALLIRLVGETGQSCIPGTGSSTEFAVLVNRIRNYLEESKRSDVVVVWYFRSQHQSPLQVITFLVNQLSLFLPEPRPDPPPGSSNYADLSKCLQNVMLKLILSGNSVILVMDQAHLAEQRVLGMVMSFLRSELQPWLYGIRKPGYIRVVFNGENGYSFPSGIPISTVQLNGLSRHSVEIILHKKLSSAGKYLAPKHVKAVSKKSEAWRWQYLNIAVEILKHYWVFEQHMDLCAALPETLVPMYGLLLQRLEYEFGFENIQGILNEIVLTKSLSLNDIQIENKDKKQDLAAELRKLLRIPEDHDTIRLSDKDLETAINSRYHSNIDSIRASESEIRASLEKSRDEMIRVAEAFVLEHNIGKKTPCSSLEEAFDLAASGDTILLCEKEYRISKTILIDRNLSIQLEDGVSHASISIERGQRAFQLESKQDLWNNKESEISNFLVSIKGVHISQIGFEAEELPRTIFVGSTAELYLSDCTVSCDQGIGVVVGKSGKLKMERTVCMGCGIHALLVQRDGLADLVSSQLIANAYHEVQEEEQKLHDLFIRFCMGVPITSKSMQKNQKEQERILITQQMGQRAETLDLNEFLALLAELKIYPVLVTKTDVAEAYELSTSHLERELDWRGFRNSLYHICKLNHLAEVCDVKITENFKFSGNESSTMKGAMIKWYYSDGLVLDGPDSTVTMNDCYICGAIHGCLVKSGGCLILTSCKIARCGKSRLDAAGVVVSGKNSRAELSSCNIFMSENNAIVVRYGGSCKLKSSTIRNSGRQGLVVVGRGSIAEMINCSISVASGCGMLAGKESMITASDCKIMSCLDAGVLARYLGTKITLKNCLVHGNSRGIAAENEAVILLEGAENIKDSIGSSRKGILRYIHSSDEQSRSHIQEQAEEHTAEFSVRAVADGACDTKSIKKSDTSSVESDLLGQKRMIRSLGQCKNKPELNKVIALLSTLFENVAEASVVIDTNAEGSVSKSELQRFCARLGLEVNTKALFDELQLTEKNIEEITTYDFIRWFGWHDKEMMAHGRWKWLLIEAQRSRRRIMDRLYERLKQDRPVPNIGQSKSLEHRLRLRFKNHSISLRESISRTAIDQAERTSVFYVKAGLVFLSSKEAITGQNPITKYPTTHGLPGVPKCFGQKRIKPKFLEMTTCTLSRYPCLMKGETCDGS